MDGDCSTVVAVRCDLRDRDGDDGTMVSDSDDVVIERMDFAMEDRWCRMLMVCRCELFRVDR